MSSATGVNSAANGGLPRLFDGADVRVVDARGFGSAACVVTFTSWTDDFTLDRPGFGEDFLRAEGIDAVHVVSRDNRWWQYGETLPAMAAVRAAVAGYARVVTYGSSMGAYAAVRLAGEAGAGVVLAMSPQFSILPSAAPFEHRWASTSRSLRPVWEATLPSPRPAEAYLVHDPRDLDGGHVALYARSGLPFTPVRLRNVGHHTAGFLSEADLLKSVVREVVAGPLDASALEREAWRRRRRSPQHLLTLAAHAHAPDLRLALTRRALRLAPESPVLLSRLGEALIGAGRPEEALAAHARALESAPGWAPLVAAQAEAFVAAGDPDAARASFRDLAARSHDPAHIAAAAELDEPRPPGRRAGTRRARRCDPGVRPAAGAAPIRVAADETGCVLCGPYLLLRPGRYAVTFGVTAEAAPLRPLRDLLPAAVFDVVLSWGVRLARRSLSTYGLRGAGGRITLEFDMPERAACEFRVFAQGRTGLVVDPARPCRRIGRAR